MSDVLPDRLSVDPDSPFHDADLLMRGVGIDWAGWAGHMLTAGLLMCFALWFFRRIQPGFSDVL